MNHFRSQGAFTVGKKKHEEKKRKKKQEKKNEKKALTASSLEIEGKGFAFNTNQPLRETYKKRFNFSLYLCLSFSRFLLHSVLYHR